MKIGILFRLASFWVGVHYSPHNKRWCINLVPCVTIWVTKSGGNTPTGPDYVSAAEHYEQKARKLCQCNQGRVPCTCIEPTQSVYGWQP